MNKTLSAYDLCKAEPLSGFTQFDCIDLNNLERVNNVLAILGFDLEKPICVEPNLHRTLSNEVKVGYVFKGYLNRKREHVYGEYSTIDDMFAYAEGEGQDWYNELMAMQSRCVGYGSQDALDDKIPERVDPEYKAEEEKLTQEIALLNSLLYIARGDQRKADGSYKTARDYVEPEPAPEKRTRKKKIKDIE